MELLQAGKPLDGHDGVPEKIRQIVLEDEREREEKERHKMQPRKRKRKQRDLHGSSNDIRMSHCHCSPVHTAVMCLPSTPRMVLLTTSIVELNTL